MNPSAGSLTAGAGAMAPHQAANLPSSVAIPPHKRHALARGVAVRGRHHLLVQGKEGRSSPHHALLDMHANVVGRAVVIGVPGLASVLIISHNIVNHAYDK